MRGLREYRICRLCLSTGCHLVDILEESRNDEFVVKQAVEDLLQLVVLEEALYPWLVCSICLEKLRDFHFFKRRCVESQEVYDSRIRGKMWPVNQVRSTECDDIPIKSEKDNAVEDPLQHDVCKNVNSDHSSRPSSEGLSIDYKVQVNSEPSRNVGSGEAEELLGIYEDSLSLRDPLCLDDVKSEVTVKSEESFEHNVQDKDPCSGEGDQNSESESRVKVEQSDNEDIVKEDETFVGEGGDSGEPKAGDVTIHGMEVESSAIEKDGAGNCVSGKGQEAVSEQDSISRYTPCPFLAEELNTDSNTASAPGDTDTSRRRSRSAIRGSGRDISRDRGGSSSFFCQRKVRERFICVECGASFVSKLTLLSHIRAHHSRMEDTLAAGEGQKLLQDQENEHGTKFPRSYCEELFGTCLELRGERFICVHCGKACVRKAQLISHIRSHSGHLNRHMRTHDGKRGFECKLCRKKFSQDGQLSSHMKIHDVKRPFECEVCNKKFSRKDTLSHHMRTHDGVRPFECQVCNKKFSQSSHLSSHMRTHNGVRPFECQVCNKKFSQSGHLSSHMRTHDVKKPFECEVCNKKFSRKDTLSHHMRTHDVVRPFECQVCNRKFSQSGHLSSHMRTHDGKRPFECQVCNKKFSQSGHLSSHMRTHDGKRPFECEDCNKKFSRKDTLSHHMRTHDGKRPFECELCNKKFIQSGHLSIHMRTHDGKRPFECEVCKKRFSQSGNLRSHMRIHDGQKNFECEVCKYTFLRKVTLSVHMKTHSGEAF